MLTKEQRGLFQLSIIAQDDDNDYDESGYVVVKIDDWCAIASYSHCSCYGTWTSITNGGVSIAGNCDPMWDWTGTSAELLNLVTNRLDPVMPIREMNTEDYNYDHLSAVYEQVIEYFKKNPLEQEKKEATVCQRRKLTLDSPAYQTELWN